MSSLGLLTGYGSGSDSEDGGQEDVAQEAETSNADKEETTGDRERPLRSVGYRVITISCEWLFVVSLFLLSFI